jgi:HMG (high mobility group) box
MDSYNQYNQRRRKPRQWEWKKQPGYPKRPLSAYNCFYRDERMRMLEEIPMNTDRGGLPGMSKLIAQRWKGLSTEMKHPYEIEAYKEKVQYDKKVRHFKVKILLNFESEETEETTVVSTDEAEQPSSSPSHSSEGTLLSAKHTPGFVDKNSCIISPISFFEGNSANVLTTEYYTSHTIPFNPVSEGATTRYIGTEKFDMSSMYDNWSDQAVRETFEMYCNTAVDAVASSQNANCHNSATANDPNIRNIAMTMLTHAPSGNDTVPTGTLDMDPISYAILQLSLGQQQQQHHAQESNQISCDDDWECQSVDTSAFFDNDFTSMFECHNTVPSDVRNDNNEENFYGDYQS